MGDTFSKVPFRIAPYFYSDPFLFFLTLFPGGHAKKGKFGGGDPRRSKPNYFLKIFGLLFGMASKFPMSNKRGRL